MKLLLAFVPLLLGLNGCPGDVRKEPSIPLAAVSEVGRYTIIHSPEIEKDTMLIDTVTGQTWNLVVLTDVNREPYAWEPVPQLNTPGDYTAMAEKYGAMPKSTKTP